MKENNDSLEVGKNLNLVGKPSIDKPWLKYYTKEQQETEIPKMTVYQYLRANNQQYLGRTALKYYGKKITYDELFEKIDDTAKALKAIGVKENDIVTISMPNTPEVVYLFYAMSKIGAIANMVDPRTSDKGIEDYIKEVNSDIVIIVDSYYNKVKNLSENGTVKKIITISPANSLPLGLNYCYKAKEFIDSLKKPDNKYIPNNKTINWMQFIKEGKSYVGSAEAEYIPNKPLVIEHTGGTTGKPKGVLLSNDNINAVAIQSVLTGIDMKREHNWMDIMPTFIAYGVGMGLHLPLTIGMETILIPQFDAKKFDELIYKHKPIHMIGVPSYWGTIIKSKKLAKKNLSYMIAPTVGGDAMDEKLEVDANNFLKSHNCSSKIVKGYGMTEVTGGVAGTVDANNQVGSVGIPFVKTTISIFDTQTGKELSYNQIGEVCITGPNVMLGYYNNESATNDILKKHDDGQLWIHSGDIGYMKPDGSLFIVNRIKRVLIRYDGFKVFPSFIENVILSHKAVDSCKVVAIDDCEHSQGKLPKAHIVLKDEYKFCSEEVLDEIKILCASKLPEYCQPVDYKIRDYLPLTPIGKVDYLKLEAEDYSENNHGNIVKVKKFS